MTALEPIAMRGRVAARSELFAIGEPARCYYFHLSGEMLVLRLPMSGRGKSAIRFMSPDELFIFDFDGKHLASCSAITDCVVLRIDRRRLDQMAALDPTLRGVLHRLHAGEIEWFLQSLGAYDSMARHDRTDKSETEFVADPTSGQWQQSTVS